MVMNEDGTVAQDATIQLRAAQRSENERSNNGKDGMEGRFSPRREESEHPAPVPSA